MELILNKLTFSELSPDQLYRIIQARLQIFVVEQVCPYLDLDDLDQEALHLWYEFENQLIAYIRVLPKGMGYPDHCSIGRVVTHSDYRGQGLGKRIFEQGLAYCARNYPGVHIKISAQLYLKNFYGPFGFEQVGKVYLEDGIPHISMVKV